MTAANHQPRPHRMRSHSRLSRLGQRFVPSSPFRFLEMAGPQEPHGALPGGLLLPSGSCVRIHCRAPGRHESPHGPGRDDGRASLDQSSVGGRHTSRSEGAAKDARRDLRRRHAGREPDALQQPAEIRHLGPRGGGSRSEANKFAPRADGPHQRVLSLRPVRTTAGGACIVVGSTIGAATASAR